MRKGAVRAHEGEYLLIPLSMKDGVLFCKGKGNPDWNKSAPHGAGRLMSRRQAKETLTVEEYKKQMAEAGVWSTCIGRGTLDESPMAYKDSAEIKRVIGDTVEILDHWKEVYNFKAKE
jgi:RNA-splicing ligase RtcB